MPELIGLRARFFMVIVMALLMVVVNNVPSVIHFPIVKRVPSCAVNLAAPHTYPPVALISAPGSGNTWVRHLLEQATGSFTGSVFEDPELFEGGFIGELEDWKSGTTIVVKTHTRNIHQMKHYSAAILLVRNPVTSAISECNRLLADQRHLGTVEWDEETVQSPEFVSLIQETIDRWEDVMTTWLTLFTGPLYVVNYEDIVDNTVPEMGNMLRFLNVSEDVGRMECLKSNIEGRFHRHVVHDQNSVEFKVVLHIVGDVEVRMARVSSLLTRRGFKPVDPVRTGA
ncbi:sialate:O-sulfotransferase 1-like [Saccoglossus kowalevskii]